MGASQNFNISLNINANAQSAEKQLQNLQKQLQQISNMKVDVGVGNLTADIEQASQAAMKLSAHLATATNPQTGNLDFTKFYSSIQKSGASLQEYGAALQKMGPAGQKAFVSLADSISKSEIPLKRTSKMVDKMWDGLKRTAGWQVQSSIIHGIVGGVQQAVGYAKDLNKSLTDIRIVTGQSTDQMAKFAKEANKAAKNLSTTTTDYTKASLIYYQQGLSEAEVKARTETTIKMANATGTSAQKVSDQMTAIWNNYDNGTKSLTHYADVMTALGAATASSTDEIAQGLQKFASISNTVGLSYEYAASALATITAESRESADVVGNALKTLFSRIQGLQLGETLDDGTTLNKYSTALAKVGISIKDQAGGLKDMDDILDEMGSKWDTLARDEKMALAQTVAGVRQYTQLMTLMENWDDFKSNLNIANTSAGTLDTQAAIYAESWEAASNRVRASWEGLWDNLIDSDGAVKALDLMSSFVNVLEAITTGLGGAGGVLSHFSAIFLKLFTPKIGESINNIGYGIKMMFGGKDQMKLERERWLEDAKGVLSGDSGMFDIGVSEGKAYQDVLQQRINTSLAYSKHWSSMSDEEKIYAQAVQRRYEEFGANYIAAGQQYDSSRTALGEAFWDLYQLNDDDEAINPLDVRKKPLQYSEVQRLKSHQESLKKIQGKNGEFYQRERVKHEAVIRELEAKQGLTYGERLRKQASAMLDFEETIGSLGDDSIKNMAAFETGWAQLDEVISTTDKDKIPKGVKLFKEQMQALIEAGDIEGAKAYAAGSSKGLNDIVARTFAEELDLDRDTLISYMDNATEVETSKRNFEAYQRYQKQLEQQELDGRKKDPRNWGEGLASTAEGAMATISLVQQINALAEGGMSAGEAIASVVTGIGSAGMAVSGFASALQAVGLASGAAAGWIGLLITALGVLGSFAVDYLSDVYNADKIAAKQAAETAATTASAHQQAISYNASLKTQVENYQNLQNEIATMKYGSPEREQAIYESNKIASALISEGHLSEAAGDYTHNNGQTKISNLALKNMQEQSEEDILNTDAASQLAQLEANKKRLQSQDTDLERDMLSQGGAGIGAKVLTGLEWATGAFLTAAGVATGWTGAGIAVAGAGLAGMAHATSRMEAMNNYEKDISRGMSIIEKDKTILDKQQEEFLSSLTEQGISQQAAEILWKNKTQLTNYNQALEEQNVAYDLLSESLTRNIVAQNENISNLDQNEKILGGATKKYTEAVDKTRQDLSTFSDKTYDEKQRLAEEVKSSLGLSNLRDFQWTGDDTKDKELTYTYTDDSGATQQGQVSYDRIINAQVSQAGVDAVNQYSDSMAGIYKSLQQDYDKDTTNGLFSMLAGDDFKDATQKEIDAAMLGIDNLQEKFKDVDTWEEYASKIQSVFGVTTEQFQEMFDVDFSKIHINEWLKQFENFESSASKLFTREGGFLTEWFTGSSGQQISSHLTQNTLTSLYSNFKKASLLGGEQSGKAMLEGITDILNNSNLDVDDYDAAVQGLMAIDWSDTLTSSGAAADVISNLGGELNTATSAWEAFAAAMAAAAGAMPDFSSLISQLTQLAGSLQGITKGSTVSKDIRDQLVAMDPAFADLFAKHFSGDYTFLGEDSSSLTNAIWDKMDTTKAQADEVKKKYDDYIKNRQGEMDNDDITMDDFVLATATNNEGSRRVTIGHASNLGVIAGYSDEAQADILDGYTNAKNNLDAWGSETGRILSDGRVVKRGSDGKFQVIENGVARAATDSETYDFNQEYEADQGAYGAAKGAADTMLNTIHGLDEISGEWKPEEIEQRISAANSLSEVFERIRSNQSGLVDDNESLTESTLKGIQAWAAQNETSERTQAAIDQLVRAEQALTEVRENNGDVEQAEIVRDEALAYAELQANIDAAATSRGLDADILASHVESFRSSVERLTDSQGKIIESTDAYNKRLLALAIEYEENSDGLSDLQSAYKSYNDAVKKGNSQDQTKSWENMRKAISKITKLPLNKVTNEFMEQAKAAGILEKALNGDADAIAELEDMSRMEAMLDTTTEIGKALQSLSGEEGFQLDFGAGIEGAKNFVSELNDVLSQTNMGQMISDANADMASTLGGLFNAMVQQMGGGADAIAAASKAFNNMGIGVTTSDSADADVVVEQSGTVQEIIPDGNGGLKAGPVHTIEGDVDGGGGATGIKFYDLGGGGGGSGGGGGGGGGGGPKKVANKRKSQTVKRYKRNDARRSNAQSFKKSAEKSKDYLYGESKIAQMEKINKLAEKEAHITSDRIKESQKYLKEDRENLIKVMQKWGYEASFDEDGFLTSYEEAWTKVHEKIAKLYEDNELTDDEKKLEEDYKVELEELEGALEDYENSLKELQADIEAYEESLYEMYDNKVEQMQHKVEFKIELNEDDLSYLDFWIEALGDSLYNALESLQTMGQKTNVLFSALDTYKQGVEDIYALSDDPLHTWATGGLDEVLTQDQVDALRENRDGLMEYMQQLLDLRETMQDKVLEVFDKWQEKLNSTMSTIEHYGSVLEHFKNIIDIVGKESLGLNDQFMSNLEQNAVNQSMDTIDATKSHYDAIVASNAEAQKNLEEAIASGDQSRIEHWEEVVKSTTEAMQEAQDSLLSSLENTLTMITEQFESAMTRAVEAFNDAIYAHGGLQGLQEDYSLIREQSELMAEDYQKIYELSKLNRNINKTLNDSNIIAGKQKMKSLQQEINELQASGVQLSQYDLEYLQAKYELRLAEIELENAQNNKDTVRLSKDSEGNWSYVYTSSVDKVDEAQQKYEDALYNMQNLSYEYMEEMSSTMMQTSLAMMEEIQALRIQDFDSYEAYSAEVQRIQDKYSAYLANQQDELNKSVANNEALYNQDWQSYSATTGYKISANQEWADSYSETTLGALMGSESEMSNFADTIFGLTGILTGELGASAQNYFTNMETAMNKYGTSISGFGTSTAASITNISTKSKSAASDMKTMAQDMTKSFREISETVSNWQREFSQKISDMLTEIGTLIQNINTAIEKSANLSGDNRNSNSLIGTKEAIELLNKSGKWGEWSKNENGTVNIKGFNRDLDGNGTIDKNVDEAAIVSINAALISEIDEMMKLYFNTNSESESRKTLGEQLKQMFKDYHEFRDIVSRIYDITDLKNPTYAEPTSMDTGGYTGEWGSSGKLAMLHEKELVLNQNDTANFLDALNISRDVLHSMIEMSAKQSSLALGNLIPSSIQDMSQNLEQQVSIVAEFPNAVERNEIEEAFNNLINTASQYANRHKV